MPLVRIFILCLGLLVPLPPALAADAVARIARVQGNAWSGQTPLSAGQTLASGERLTTGAASRLELSFSDGTKVTLGENSDLTIADFSFAASQGSARLNARSGAFLVSTGAIARLPGRPFVVTTPVASIGVRGTRFWAGTLDRPLEVLLLDGAVTVRSKGGSVDLEEAMQGTDISAAGAAPAPPARWKPERVERALRAVAFD